MIMKTNSGFEYELDKDRIVDDWELVEDLVAADGGDTAAGVRAMKAILGEKTYKALKEHVRNENGKVSSVKLQAEFLEILNQAQEETKN